MNHCVYRTVIKVYSNYKAQIVFISSDSLCLPNSNSIKKCVPVF